MSYLKTFIKENFLFILFLIVLLLFRIFIFPLYTVEGKSMNDTLSDGQLVIGNKFFSLDRFDVVIVESPRGDLVVKRIIGLPGEEIEYINNQLYINKQLTDESFLNQNTLTEDLKFKIIPENEYLILGDNREHSIDSRNYGFVNKEQIISEVEMVYWPLTDFKIIK